MRRGRRAILASVTRRYGFLLATLGLLAMGPALASDLTHATVVAPASSDAVRSARRSRCWSIPCGNGRASRGRRRRRIRERGTAGGDDSARGGGQRAAGGRLSTAHLRQRRGAGRGDHGQRRARRSVRRGRAVARARNAARLGHAAGHAGYPDRAEVRAARPSIGLPAEDQLLRRVERPDVGELHPRPGGLRRQRHRADSAALGRCGRQPAFSAAADADDGRDVAPGAGVRPAMLDLVSGDGSGLLEPRDGGGRAEGVGRSFPASCRGSTRCSCPAATPATPSRGT